MVHHHYDLKPFAILDHYINQSMKNFYSFLLFLLLAWSLTATPFTPIAHVGPLSVTALNCLKSDGVVTGVLDRIVLRIYQNSHSPAGVDPQAASAIANAHSAGYYIGSSIEICRGINATSQINSLSSVISSAAVIDAGFGKKARVWIQVIPSANPDCSWEGYSHTDNCNFLIEAINALNSLPSTAPGVFSTANIWKSFFGNSCDSIGTSTTWLWYAIYGRDGKISSTQTFDDFVPFGGWTVAGGNVYIKKVGSNVAIPALCGNPALHAKVDLIWGPTE